MALAELLKFLHLLSSLSFGSSITIIYKHLESVIIWTGLHNPVTFQINFYRTDFLFSGLILREYVYTNPSATKKLCKLLPHQQH